MLIARKSASLIAASLLFCSSIFAFGASALAGARRALPDLTRDGLPNIQSVSTIVADLNTGEVLFERESDTVRPIASISKLMGALVVHEECKLDPAGLHVMTSANREAAKGGDHSKLTTGWAFSHRDLFHAALLRSDNRALPALGEACGLTPEQLGQKMTQRARKMGLTKTYFREPDGLSIENVSTAREVAVFLKAAVGVPELAKILTTSTHVLTATKDGRSRQIQIRSTDRLLTKGIAEILGGKTGYTDPARYCFAVAANMHGLREVAMVFLGGEGRHTRFADFTRVTKWLRGGKAPISVEVARSREAASEQKLASARAVDASKVEADAAAAKQPENRSLGMAPVINIAAMAAAAVEKVNAAAARAGSTAVAAPAKPAAPSPAEPIPFEKKTLPQDDRQD